MAEIAFRNVTKRYGSTLAVDDASFTVNDNEFFCFFGPPLSGKTTILRLMLGLETPDHGRDPDRRQARSTRCRRPSAMSPWCSRTWRCFRI